MKSVYLGDSVYAEFDGYHVILTTRNGYSDDPRNRIALEPAVFFALRGYFVQCHNQQEVSDASECGA